jgi:hypothetical protein
MNAYNLVMSKRWENPFGASCRKGGSNFDGGVHKLGQVGSSYMKLWLSMHEAF